MALDNARGLWNMAILLLHIGQIFGIGLYGENGCCILLGKFCLIRFIMRIERSRMCWENTYTVSAVRERNSDNVHTLVSTLSQ